ncbi:hypothetical protein MKW92_043708 [Papaver armeniacum]|nr:hypothetical protein MKW92_043708 [Papaver armeniacum]
MPSMIKGVHKLVNLQYFPVFVVGKDSGFGVEELRDLNHLGGKLHIHNLENVTDRKAAEAGGLKEKRHILRLELHWNDTENYDDSVRDDFEVLDGLQPHPNLRKLGIYNYVGSKFPTWMMSPNSLLINLVSISLKNCSTCENLPPLGLLPCLKVLKIDGLDAVKKIGSKFYGANSSNNVSSFPSLEDLSISRMVNLIEWSDQEEVSSFSSSLFPRLKQLKIEYCHQLQIMPTQIQSLREVKFEVAMESRLHHWWKEIYHLSKLLRLARVTILCFFLKDCLMKYILYMFSNVQPLKALNPTNTARRSKFSYLLTTLSAPWCCVSALL